MDLKIYLKYFVCCLLLTGSIATLRAQPLSASPLNCIQINGSGNPTLNWTAPPDPFSDFVAYHVWYASSINGTFSDIASVNGISNTSYTHNIITMPPSAGCYYLTVESINGGGTYFSTPSDTLCTMGMSVLPSVSPIGFANIQWTSPYPFDAPTGTQYEVMMEYPPGSWAPIGTFPFGTQSFNYEISACQAYLNFQVQALTPAGCSITSNTLGGNFTDQTPPAIPVVTSVSIDHATNDAVVSWNLSTSSDTQAYIIYSCNGNIVTSIDSTHNATDQQFTDILAPTHAGPVCYLLAAFDYCYSGTPPSPNTSPTGDICNCSIFLYPVPYGVCDNFVNLSWTAYTGWSAGVDHYNIYHRVGNDPFILIGQVQGTETTFVHSFTTIDSGVHDYYIEGVAATSGYTASSNVQSVNIIYPEAPSFHYLSSASVTSQSEVTITLQTEAMPTLYNYTFQRYRAYNNTWETIHDENHLGDAVVEFTDTDVNAAAFSYTYRVALKNLCNNPAGESNIGTTVWLTGITDQQRLVNRLQWSPYNGWENGVDSYRIYRRIGDTGANEVIATVNYTVGYYEDDVSDMLYTEGNFYYFIEAVEVPSSFFPTTSFSARSNEITLVLEPKIWVPNAFVVDGFNNTFKPVISFADFRGFQMIIYSRWGDVIYETRDINAPWRGLMNGKLVQEGTYAYYISVKDGNGRPYEKRGWVIMLSDRDQ